MAAIGLLLSDDLIFTSRIVGTARSLGLTLRMAKDSLALVALAAQEPPVCVIVDLANPGLAIEELVKKLPAPRVIAYGSHVDTETLKRARAAGCNPVLPRSKFVDELASQLPHWFAVAEDVP